jgi:hypothetical protein
MLRVGLYKYLEHSDRESARSTLFSADLSIAGRRLGAQEDVSEIPLFHRSDTGAQAGLVARRGVLVQRALLDSLVEGGNRRAIELLSGLLVALGDGLAEFTQRAAQARSIGAVAGGAAFGLAGAFQRRKMISHSWFVNLYSYREMFRWVPNFLL